MKKSNFFWVGYADLMTSLFFIMLVLYVVSFALYKNQNKDIDAVRKELSITKNNLKICELDLAKTKEITDRLKGENDILRVSEEKIKLIEAVEKNLETLKKDTTLFKYEEEYKRFTLAFGVKFKDNKYKLSKNSFKEKPAETIKKIKNVGFQLKNTLDELARKKMSNPEMKNVSYLIIISGYSSKLKIADEDYDYKLSYERALNLWKYWKSLGIDFEAEKYKGLIDLQISGNGWGGVGRFERDPKNNFKNETKNQRFIIQIVPKIGNTN